MSTKKVLLLCGTALLLSIILEIAFVHPHAYYWWHETVGFDIAFGFLGCAAIIAVSKYLGSSFIQHEENYYDGGEDKDD